MHPPAAPLRVYRFTSAGGRASDLDDGGVPRGCVFKVGFDGINPFSGKVILMDESHHLTRPSKQYEAQLNRLRNLVETAQGSVFVALTGSMASDAASARDLLSVVKGSTQAQPATDEGFLSSHNRRGVGFPRQKPAQCADGVLSEEIEGLIHKEELVGYSFIRYVYQSVKLHKENKSQDGLACYTNIHCYFGAVGNAVCQEQLLKYNSCRPKFSVAVDDVVAAARLKQKSLVVVSKRTGYKVMQWLLEAAGKKHGFNAARQNKIFVLFREAYGIGRCLPSAVVWSIAGPIADKVDQSCFEQLPRWPTCFSVSHLVVAYVFVSFHFLDAKQLSVFVWFLLVIMFAITFKSDCWLRCDGGLQQTGQCPWRSLHGHVVGGGTGREHWV